MTDKKVTITVDLTDNFGEKKSEGRIINEVGQALRAACPNKDLFAYCDTPFFKESEDSVTINYIFKPFEDPNDKSSPHLYGSA